MASREQLDKAQQAAAEWLVKYQVKGQSFAQIADEANASGEWRVTPEIVRRAATEFAALIELPLRSER